MHMHIKSLVQGTVLFSLTQQCMSLPHDSVLPQGDAGECHTFYCHMWKLFPMRTGCDAAGPTYPRHKNEFCTTGWALQHYGTQRLQRIVGTPAMLLFRETFAPEYKQMLKIPSSPLYIITLQHKHVNKWICRDQSLSLSRCLYLHGSFQSSFNPGANVLCSKALTAKTWEYT